MTPEEDYKELVRSKLNSRVKNYHKLRETQEEAWIILIDGARTTLPSKKSIWNKLTHAKSALRCAYSVSYIRYDSLEYEDRGRIQEEVYQEFLSTHVEFKNIGGSIG